MLPRTDSTKKGGGRETGLPASGHARGLSIDEVTQKMALYLGYLPSTLAVFGLCAQPKGKGPRGNTIYVWDEQSSVLFHSVFKQLFLENDVERLPQVNFPTERSPKNDCLQIDLWQMTDPYLWDDLWMIVSPEGKVLLFKTPYSPCDYAVPPDGRKYTVWTHI